MGPSAKKTTCHPTLVICFDRPQKGAEVLSHIWTTPGDLFLFRDGGGQESSDYLYKRMFKEIAHLRERHGYVTHIRQEPENLGGCNGPATALRWFFEQTPKGIVLEEDILPHATMIPAYSSALDEFENDPSIFALGAAPNLHIPRCNEHTWARSPLFLVWGWAGWADRILPACIPNPNHNASYPHLNKFQTLAARLYMKRELQLLEKNPKFCWSYHLQTLALIQGQDILIPSVKLTQNIGIEAGALRTKDDHDEAPQSYACDHFLEEPPTIWPETGKQWKKWQARVETAKFRGITHEIRNRLSLRNRISTLLGH